MSTRTAPVSSEWIELPSGDFLNIGDRLVFTGRGFKPLSEHPRFDGGDVEEIRLVLRRKARIADSATSLAKRALEAALLDAVAAEWGESE